MIITDCEAVALHEARSVAVTLYVPVIAGTKGVPFVIPPDQENVRSFAVFDEAVSFTVAPAHTVPEGGSTSTLNVGVTGLFFDPLIATSGNSTRLHSQSVRPLLVFRLK